MIPYGFSTTNYNGYLLAFYKNEKETYGQNWGIYKVHSETYIDKNKNLFMKSLNELYGVLNG